MNEINISTNQGANLNQTHEQLAKSLVRRVLTMLENPNVLETYYVKDGNDVAIEEISLSASKNVFLEIRVCSRKG